MVFVDWGDNFPTNLGISLMYVFLSECTHLNNLSAHGNEVCLYDRSQTFLCWNNSSSWSTLKECDHLCGSHLFLYLFAHIYSAINRALETHVIPCKKHRRGQNTSVFLTATKGKANLESLKAGCCINSRYVGSSDGWSRSKTQ